MLYRSFSKRPILYGRRALMLLQDAIWFMTRAELMLRPVTNGWGESRRSALSQHLALYTTLYPDERTCGIWAEVVNRCRCAGQPIQTAMLGSLPRRESGALRSSQRIFGTMLRSTIWTFVPIL